MKVVFALPPYDYSRSVGNTRKGSQIGLLPPLGVGYLAAMLEQHGHTAALVDAVAEQLDVEQTTRAIAAHQPGIIGLSSFTSLSPESNDAYTLAQALKEALPQVPIIMGGPHVTSFARTILGECPHVDVLIPGDAEIPLAQLVDRLAQGEPYADLDGLVYRGQDGEPVFTPPAQVVQDIDDFPHPARHIYKDELYCPLPSLSSRRPATSMITSRGCPWARCRFCYQGGEFAPPYRRRSPENVVDEMTRLASERNIRNIVFWDDNFCMMPEWIEAFCDLLDARKLDIVWSVLSRVNTVTPAMLKRMARSGCYSIQYGIETGNQDLLKLINKGHTLQQCRDAVKWAKQAGMDTRAFFMLGLPTETPGMSRQTIQFACELNIDYVVFFSYHLAPGTQLAQIAAEHGVCHPYVGQHLPSYVPNTYHDAGQLGEMVRSAYHHYYLRPRYIARALTRLIRRPSLIKNHVLGFYYWFGLMRARWGADPLPQVKKYPK